MTKFTKFDDILDSRGNDILFERNNETLTELFITRIKGVSSTEFILKDKNF